MTDVLIKHFIFNGHSIELKKNLECLKETITQSQMNNENEMPEMNEISLN